MKTYTIEIKGTIIRTVDIQVEAYTREEAQAKAQAIIDSRGVLLDDNIKDEDYDSIETKILTVVDADIKTEDIPY